MSTTVFPENSAGPWVLFAVPINFHFILRERKKERRWQKVSGTGLLQNKLNKSGGKNGKIGSESSTIYLFL